jgi:phosphonate transport system permease protein
MTSIPASPRTWRKPPFISNPRTRWILGIGFAVYLALAFGTLEINWGRVLDGLPRGQKFIAAFFPPDFVSRWDAIVEGIYESLWMTVTSTVVGIAISIPVGLGAARNLAPAPVYYFCRGILAVSRSFQEVILGQGNRRQLVPMAELQRPASGHAPDDRSRPLSFRYQFP